MASARTKKRLKGTIFDKKRFEWMEKERTQELRKLSFSKASEIQEDILTFCAQLRKNFQKDNPVSYELLLQNRK